MKEVSRRECLKTMLLPDKKLRETPSRKTAEVRASITTTTTTTTSETASGSTSTFGKLMGLWK